MSYTIGPNASDDLIHDVERLHEYIVDQLGFSTYDVEITTNDDSIEVTIGPGAAAPPDWSSDVLEKYCSHSKRERRRLDRHYCQPDRFRAALIEDSDAQ